MALDVAVDPTRGLSEEEVAERRARGEVNDVPATPTRTVGQIVRANVVTLFNAILAPMVVIVLLAGSPRDALFGIVLVANSLIGIVQEIRAKRTLERLTLLTAPRARVVRDGSVREVGIDEVVLDDVLDAPAGSQVIVDGVVVASAGMEVDESLLTGESEPVGRAQGEHVLSGSFVVAGSGRYRATEVGAGAYAVRLAQDARRFTLAHSELRAGINRLLLYITWAIIPMAALLFVSQQRAHHDVREALTRAVAGTVAMVPEGLVLLTSVAFAVSVVRLGRQRVLIQELPAVEGLARVDVLCIDKTGTLTEGRLALEEIETLDTTEPAPVLAAMAAADPAPNATILAIARDLGEAPDWRVDRAVPFSSARKWSGAVFQGHGAWVLGAPDALVPWAEGRIGAAIAERTAAGHRVLLLARVEGLREDAFSGIPEPVAIVSLADRPRPDAARTLAYLAEQDVAVKVISGDHPATVGAVASALGLAGAAAPIDAATLPADDPEALADALEGHSVFGRTTPAQKRAMIGALQARGHTVAMTGDGVNDALALKDADLGVAMGSGSDATRAVAQIVLLDATFDAMPSVMGEGRRVLGNIERTSGLYLTKTVYAMLLSLAVSIGGFVFPFLPRHLTLIGAITIGIPSFFLALEPTAERFRPGFVPRVLRFSVPTGAVAAVGTFLAYTLATNEPGVSPLQAQTAAVMTLLWIGLLVLSIVAWPLGRWRLALVWWMVGLAVAALAVPWSQKFFALDMPPLVLSLAGIGIAALTWFFARLFVPTVQPGVQLGESERDDGS